MPKEEDHHERNRGIKNGAWNGSTGASNIEQNEAKHDKLLRRIDFGSSYIMGQTIKSGAVYLLRRKQTKIKSMLKRRKDYRKEILEDFYVQNMNSD